MKRVPSEKMLKDLMLGLIYPAVLGSVLYFALDEVRKQVIILFDSGFDYSLEHVNRILAIKFLLVFITVAFYICDYLYVTFTNYYRKLFFIFDLIFVLTLFFTFTAIDITNGKSLPDNRIILAFYALFMVPYLIWDWSEKSVVEKKEGEIFEREAGLYKWIVRWEIASIVLIGVCLYLSLKSYDRYTITAIIALILLAITLCFAVITYKKREFYWLPPLEEGGDNRVMDRNIEQAPMPNEPEEGSLSKERHDVEDTAP